MHQIGLETGFAKPPPVIHLTTSMQVIFKNIFWPIRLLQPCMVEEKVQAYMLVIGTNNAQ